MMALVGNGFLLAETVRLRLGQAGFVPREVAWLDEEVTPALVESHLAAGLFGPAALVVDIASVKDYKAIVTVLVAVPEAFTVLLDPENWSSGETSAEITRKKKAQEARAKLYGQHGEVVLLPSPQKGALVKWIGDRAKAMKLKLEGNAGQVLAEIFPDDPAAIASELEKLSLWEGKVDGETVRKIVNHQPPTTVFAVLEAVAQQQAKVANHHLMRLLDAGEEPIKLMGALVNQYQLNARVFALRDNDPLVRPDDVAKTLSIHAFRAQKALEAVRGLSEARVRAHLASILRADVAMKSGLEPKLVLEGLVLELAGV
jgi:DNA polymerase III subunit delta